MNSVGEESAVGDEGVLGTSVAVGFVKMSERVGANGCSG